MSRGAWRVGQVEDILCCGIGSMVGRGEVSLSRCVFEVCVPRYFGYHIYVWITLCDYMNSFPCSCWILMIYLRYMFQGYVLVDIHF